MKFTSVLIDHKIHGINVAAELTIGEYWEFARGILKSNEYQRSKVRTQGKTYDLLKADLIQGCVIPPIILAISDQFSSDISPIFDRDFLSSGEEAILSHLKPIISKAISSGGLLILDGLQRSLTIQSCISDLNSDKDRLAKFLTNKIRIEIYLGLSKTGILYRMLTLNTGQTPMSFRHQLEILYHDYLQGASLPKDMTIVREVEDAKPVGLGAYKYQDVIDMFYAFSTESPMPFDKATLVGELREMQFLESYEYRRNSDEMLQLLLAYDRLVRRLDKLSHGWQFDKALVPGISRPFGTNVPAIFSRAQPMSGFGAECKRLFRLKSVAGFDELQQLIDKTTFHSDSNKGLHDLVQILNEIASKAKKIGDSQRIYFQYAFRSLLNPESGTFLDAGNCWIAGQGHYELMF
ncbi:hypothetical protein [Rhizobium sp. Leaf386]|uniref:hypothetical protein n=1 Tax=Rhizobium sp. Leaf386 TaxID=1736359 RepID=UPI00071557BA|nr:hypothetical protein [Rhizobium sp. Leaf386]KQT06994.1 hypothetical protein ASG50_00750 [Rhizobium sp. Leaf386]